ncbi:hypothetical protein GF351_01800 [Candidatus Woesearchaeota archaeon]|nr:hypothetical protein [Candidatus Woesearchaeota archaeon]
MKEAIVLATALLTGAACAEEAEEEKEAKEGITGKGAFTCMVTEDDPIYRGDMWLSGPYNSDFFGRVQVNPDGGALYKTRVQATPLEIGPLQVGAMAQHLNAFDKEDDLGLLVRTSGEVDDLNYAVQLRHLVKGDITETNGCIGYRRASVDWLCGYDWDDKAGYVNPGFNLKMSNKLDVRAEAMWKGKSLEKSFVGAGVRYRFGGKR